MSRLIYLTNISYNLPPPLIAKWLEQAGELINFTALTRSNGSFSGRCLIQYDRENSAGKAIQKLDRSFYGGRMIIFHYFDPGRFHPHDLMHRISYGINYI